MRYLILGSEGQIGKSLVDFLRIRGEEVLEYDIKRDELEDLRFLRVDNEKCWHFLDLLWVYLFLFVAFIA